VDLPARTIQHVLVVDDSRLQRRILGALLKKWGFAVTEADSGDRALEICREAPPIWF
jgi:sigma-B regulation protein RsbU (phosphoserine phosphatase)